MKTDSAQDESHSESQANDENLKREDALPASLFWAALVLLLGFASVYVWQLCDVLSLAYDRALIPVGSELLLSGGRLYQDLHTVMLPGSYYFLAAIFAIFGISNFVCHAYALATILGTALFLLLVSRHFLKSYDVFLPAAFLLVIGTYTTPFVSHHWDALLLLLLYLLLLLKVDSVSVSSKFASFTLFLSGFFGGLSFLTYQNHLLPLLVGSVWLVWQARNDDRQITKGLVLWYFLGLLLPVFLTIAYLAFNGSLLSMYDCTVKFVLENYGQVNKVPYGWSSFETSLIGSQTMIWGLFSSLPFGVMKLAPLIVVLSIVPFLIKSKCAKKQFSQNPQIILLFAIGFALWFSELHKPDLKRLAFGEPLLLICFFYQIAQIKMERVKLLVAAALLALAVGLLVTAQAIRRQRPYPAKVYKTRRGPIQSLVDLRILSRLNKFTKPGETILVYHYDTAFYFLSGTKFPNRFPSLQYGYHSQEQIKAVRDEMLATKPRYVVLNLAMNEKVFAASGFHGYVHPAKENQIIENFVRDNYESAGIFGAYALLKRRVEVP